MTSRAAIVHATPATVLVVEDDHDVRVSVRSVLEEDGYTVLTVTNGRSALELLDVTMPPPTLIILDLWLPVMDGWHFVEKLRLQPALAGIPIVVMSARRDRPPPSGTAGVLLKPVKRDELLRVVGEQCRDEPKKPVTQTGELTPLMPESEATSEYTPWRTTQPHEGEALRWEDIDGRWIAVTIGSGEQLGTMLVKSSSGRVAVATSYERALELARAWQRR